MSAPHPALTSPEIAALASASMVKSYLLAAPVVTPFAAATIDSGDLSFPLKDIPVVSTSGAWLDCRPFMTVWIGSGPLLKDRGVFYLRKTPISDTLYIGQVGRPDSGLATMLNRFVPIFPGDSITVLERYDLHAMRSQIAYSYGSTSGIFYKNTDRAYADDNTKPGPYWQGDSWKAIRLPDGDSTISSSFSLTGLPFLASQSAAAYQWTVPSAFTSVSGDTTDTVSFDAPNGFWVLYCTVVLNDGSTDTAIRYLWVYGDTGDIVPTELSDISDNRDRGARKATVTLKDDIRGTIDSEGPCLVIDEITYADGTVDTATVQFCGWLGTGSGDIEYGSRGSTLEILGAGAVLATLGADSQRLEQVASALDWQQAPLELMTATYFIYYLLKWGVTNYTQLFGYYPVDSSVPQTVNPYDVSQGNYLSQVQSVAKRLQYANLGTDSDGDLHVNLDPSLTPIGSRGSLVERAAITSDVYSKVSYSENNRPPNRRVIASAFTYSGITTISPPFSGMTGQRSQAPGQDTGEGANEEELTSIIIDNQDSLDLFSGQYYAQINAKYDTITFTLPGNWDVFEPAHMQRVHYVIDAVDSPTGEEQSEYGIPVSIAKRRDSSGSNWIDLSLKPETSGTKGEPYPYPPVVAPPFGLTGTQSFMDSMPGIGAGYGHENDFSPVTAPASQIKFALLAQKSDASEWRVIRVNGIGTWSASDISPTSGQRTALGAAIKLIKNSRIVKGLLLLCESGIAYASNYAASASVWVVGNTAVTPTVYDFTVSDNGFVTTDALINPLISAYPATWSAGPGWTSTLNPNFGGPPPNPTMAIVKHFTSRYATTIDITYTTGANGSGGTRAATVYANGVSITGTLLNAGTGTFTTTLSVNATVDTIFIELDTNIASGPSNSISKVTINGTGTNIFDIAISNGGNIYWLSKATISAVDYVYVNYTRNSFRTVSATQVARYDANLTYTIQISTYNPAYVWVSAGTPGTDSNIYFSSNGAVSFTAGATLNTRGGLFRVPRALPGGGYNRTALNILYALGIDSGDFKAVRDGSTAVTVSSGTSDYPITSDTLAVSPINGQWAALGLKSGDIYTSTDGGKTVSIAGTVPGSGDLKSLQQWPTNHKYLAAAGAGQLAYSITAGVSWVDLYSDFTTWSTSQYGSGVITDILTVILSEFTAFTKVVN